VDHLHQLVLKFPDVNVDLCATYVSPGVLVDAGGFMIVGGHLIRVPGWNPTAIEFTRSKVAVESASFTIASQIPAKAEREKVEKLLVKNVATREEKHVVAA